MKCVCFLTILLMYLVRPTKYENYLGLEAKALHVFLQHSQRIVAGLATFEENLFNTKTNSNKRFLFLCSHLRVRVDKIER